MNFCCHLCFYAYFTNGQIKSHKFTSLAQDHMTLTLQLALLYCPSQATFLFLFVWFLVWFGLVFTFTYSLAEYYSECGPQISSSSTVRGCIRRTTREPHHKPTAPDPGREARSLQVVLRGKLWELAAWGGPVCYHLHTLRLQLKGFSQLQSAYLSFPPGYPQGT